MKKKSYKHLAKNVPKFVLGPLPQQNMVGIFEIELKMYSAVGIWLLFILLICNCKISAKITFSQLHIGTRENAIFPCPCCGNVT